MITGAVSGGKYLLAGAADGTHVSSAHWLCMFDPPAPTTARFVILVVMFFGLLGLLTALMVGIAIKLIAMVGFALIALGGAIWLAAKLAGGGKAPGA